MLKAIIFLTILSALSSTYAATDEMKRNAISGSLLCTDKMHELNELLSDPVFTQFPLPVENPKVQKLVAEIVQLVPDDPYARAQSFGENFTSFKSMETPLVQHVNFEDNSKVFAGNLVEILSIHGGLTLKNAQGNAVLVSWLKEAQRLALENQAIKPKISEPARAELEELLKSAAMKTYPIHFGQPETKRIVEILADIAPLTTADRTEWLQVYGDTLWMKVITISPLQTNYQFIRQLIEVLSRSPESVGFYDEKSPNPLLKLIH